MTTILEITGSLGLTFYQYLGTEKVSEQFEAEIVEKLQSGEYCIALAQKVIMKSEDLSFVARFEFEVLDDIEYNFIRE